MLEKNKIELGGYESSSLTRVDRAWAGPIFTWTNGCQTDACTYVKLDRVMSNLEWLIFFPHVLAFNLAIQQSMLPF